MWCVCVRVCVCVCVCVCVSPMVERTALLINFVVVLKDVCDTLPSVGELHSILFTHICCCCCYVVDLFT